MANFLKYFPHAKLLMIIRNPIQSCESWALKALNSGPSYGYRTYDDIVNRIIPMLSGLNSPVFHEQASCGVRLEDLKENSAKTMQQLCQYMEINEAPSLYETTMQGLKWWGDPSSTLYGRDHTVKLWDDDPVRMKPGRLFSKKDLFILETLFYPLSAAFGYVEHDDRQFKKNLKEIRCLLDKPLDFEAGLAKYFTGDYPALENSSPFRSLHITLIGAWRLLDKFGTYPYMIKPI
jgi:hypothetical protein